ncbi:MAG: AarF/UbiB family protein, partial [Coriobacteriia bacterium]|nr:AarF/UbiB family protein [Coriobacteriia bacterium]
MSFKRRRRRHILWIATKHWWSGVFKARFGFVSVTERREIFAREMRYSFEQLGPAFIKLGQLISIRPDMFPPQYVFEMEDLRDSVTPTPFEDMKAIIESDFGRPIDDLFDNFDPEPVGSASIAQVYKARLKFDYSPVVGDDMPAGTELALKVIRPGSLEKIKADIAIITPIVNFVHKLKPLRRFNTPQLPKEVAESITSECDLRI